MTFSAGGAIEFGQRMLQVASQGTEVWQRRPVLWLQEALPSSCSKSSFRFATGWIQIPVSFRLYLEHACFRNNFFSHAMNSRFTGRELTCFSDKDSLSLLKVFACI